MGDYDGPCLDDRKSPLLSSHQHSTSGMSMKSHVGLFAAAAICLSANVPTVHAGTVVQSFDTFSDQRTHPFQIRGVVIFPDVNWARLPRRLEAIIVPALMVRQGVRDCVGRDQSIDPEFFDWSGMGSDEELQICLFHAFASFRSVEDIAAWLGGLGFVQEADSGALNDGYLYNRPGEIIRSYSFRWDTPGRGPFAGPRRGNVTAGLGFTYSTIEFVLDEHQRPLDVRIAHHVPAVK